MNRYNRSLAANSAGGRFQLSNITTTEIDQVMQKNDRDDVLPPMLPDNNHQRIIMTGRSGHQQQEDDDNKEYDEDMIHPLDSEWLQKIELDLAQAARLEQDLQLLCALRQQPPSPKKEKKSSKIMKETTDGEFGEMRRNNNSREHDTESNNDGSKIGNFHHNSRVLDNLRREFITLNKVSFDADIVSLTVKELIAQVEGKNSFGIPCTDIYDDDFEDELNFLLRNHRHARYNRDLTFAANPKQASRLYLSGTSINNKRLIAISSQMPMRMREDSALLRDEPSPLFADVTPVTPQKSRAGSVLQSARHNKNKTSPVQQNPSTGDSASPLSEMTMMMEPSTVASTNFTRRSELPAANHSLNSISQTMPVTHNASRTSLLGGCLPPKPSKKMFRPSLPVNQAAVLQVQMTCNSNSPLTEQQQQQQQTDCCDPTARSTYGYSRSFCSRSLVPRLWISPAWPKSQFLSSKQPFKQLRRSQRNAALMPLEPGAVASSTVAGADQQIATHIIRKNLESSGAPFRKPPTTGRSSNGLDSSGEFSGEDNNNNSNNNQPGSYYWPKKDSITNYSQYRHLVPASARGGFDRSGTQMSLGSILNAIRSANETMGITK